MWCRAVGLIMTLTLSLLAARLAAHAQSTEEDATHRRDRARYPSWSLWR
jgi:hypothetical protein